MKFKYWLSSLLIIVFLIIPCRAQVCDSVISILSFNIRYDNPGDSLNSWQFRKERVAQFIRFHDVDIFGLQEALRNQIADLDSLLTNYDWIGVGRDDGKEEGEFCPVFFNKNRFTLEEQETFWLSESPSLAGSKGWDAALPRIVTRCYFKDRRTGHVFGIFNTHLDHMGEITRRKSAELLVEKIEKSKNMGPLLVTGDFNCTDTSVVHTIMKKGGFRDAFTVSQQPNYGPNSSWNGFKEIENGNRIDFIYVYGKMRVLKHAILTDRWDGRFLSDHLPVIAEVIIQ
jgi:endonuclease/exonuclease/phosphatase family metal-dependent hydrolase